MQFDEQNIEVVISMRVSIMEGMRNVGRFIKGLFWNNNNSNKIIVVIINSRDVTEILSFLIIVSIESER